MKSGTEGNLRPGRSGLTLAVRAVANRVRSFYVLHVRHPWIRCRGFTRVPLSVDFWSPHRDIEIGHRVQFGAGCIVHCDARFGDDIIVARDVAFVGRDDHRFDVVGQTMWDAPRGDTLKVVVEDDVWIGHGAVILTGVTIGRGSVVGAGAVVVDDVPPFSVVGGNPARVLRARFDPAELQAHLSARAEKPDHA